MGLLSTNVAHDSIFYAEGINEEIIEADDDGTQVPEPIAVFFICKHQAFLNNLIFSKSRLNTVNQNFQFM